MPRRIQKEKTKTEREQEPVQEMPAPEKTEAQKKADLDSLLNEIDEVLEENAEEFTRSYIQKGGQ